MAVGRTWQDGLDLAALKGSNGAAWAGTLLRPRQQVHQRLIREAPPRDQIFQPFRSGSLLEGSLTLLSRKQFASYASTVRLSHG